jgi:hypothetical protein
MEPQEPIQRFMDRNNSVELWLCMCVWVCAIDYLFTVCFLYLPTLLINSQCSLKKTHKQKQQQQKTQEEYLNIKQSIKTMN